jgi:hypothetical protein
MQPLKPMRQQLPGLVPGIHGLGGIAASKEGMAGTNKPGHDGKESPGVSHARCAIAYGATGPMPIPATEANRHLQQTDIIERPQGRHRRQGLQAHHRQITLMGCERFSICGASNR